jgi:hypothetical protein
MNPRCKLLRLALNNLTEAVLNPIRRFHDAYYVVVDFSDYRVYGVQSPPSESLLRPEPSLRSTLRR